MAYDPMVVYPNLGIAERQIVNRMYFYWQIFTFLIPHAAWVEMWNEVGVTQQGRIDAYFQGFGMFHADPNPFNCFDPDGCESVNVPRLTAIYERLQVLILQEDMPYGDYVNWSQYPVQVPPP